MENAKLKYIDKSLINFDFISEKCVKVINE